MANCTDTERVFLDSLLDNSNRYDLVSRIKYETIPAALKSKLIKTANSKVRISEKWEALLDDLAALGFGKHDVDNIIAQVESDAASLSESSKPNA